MLPVLQSYQSDLPCNCHLFHMILPIMLHTLLTNIKLSQASIKIQVQILFQSNSSFDMKIVNTQIERILYNHISVSPCRASVSYLIKVPRNSSSFKNHCFDKSLQTQTYTQLRYTTHIFLDSISNVWHFLVACDPYKHNLHMNENNLSHNRGGVLRANCIPFTQRLIVYSLTVIERCGYALQSPQFRSTTYNEILSFPQ